MAVAEPEAAGESPGLARIARTLRYRNYRLFFSGQCISLVGTWVQQVALSWLMFRLTGSPLLLGILGFSGQIPAFLLGPISGALVDRHDRHRILLMTQSAALAQAGLLAGIVLSGKVQVWHLLVLSLLLGLVNAFDMPTRQAFVADVVERPEDLPNAIALNSALVNGARLVGPALAGVLVAAVGEGWCFLLNAASYVPVLVALTAMRRPEARIAVSQGHLLAEAGAGLAYAFGFSPIRALLLLLGVVSLLAMPYTVLMPVFASQILHGGPSAFGLLMASSGVGALVGALLLAARRTVLGLGRWILGGVILFGAGLLLFALSRWLWLSMAALAVAGFGMMVQMASCNTILQTIVEPDKRGRIMSLYAMAFMGMAPFGSLLAGALAARLGAPGTVFLGGLCALAAGALFGTQLEALRERVRPIYRRLGILPEVATGLQAATELTRPPEEMG